MLKCFDYKCNLCGREQLDVIAPSEDKTFSCSVDGCLGTMERAWLMGQGANHVHGDECDVQIRHGLCNPDGSPQRFRSKSAMKKEGQRRGYTNLVEHLSGRSGDRCKATQRFV